MEAFLAERSSIKSISYPSDVSAIQAVGTLNVTADIILTSVASGTARNTKTFTLQVVAPAANPTDTVLVGFTGTAAAIICTVTPNSGANNGAVAVALTTANLVELINTGLVAGKTITLTDLSSLRILQTATGGGATPLADSGEGDGVVATFADGSDGGSTGTRIDMGMGARCTIFVAMGGSTSATVKVNLLQHDLVTAGVSKPLEIANPYYEKNEDDTAFDRTVPGAPASVFDISTKFSDKSGIAVFEILGADLDVQGDFKYISVDIDVDGVVDEKFVGVLAVFQGQSLLSAHDLEVSGD